MNGRHDRPDEDEKAEVRRRFEESLEKLRGLREYYEANPDKLEQLQKNFADSRDAAKFAVNMIPDGMFDPEETKQRRQLWQLWIQLPVVHRPVLPELLAKQFDRPIEWVREVLNLPAG